MVNKKMKIKNKRKAFTRLLIITVLAYFLIMSIPMLRTSNAKTIPVEKDNVVDIITSKGIILKKETVYKADSKGTIIFNVDDGKKIRRNEKIAEINNATYESYKNKLKEIDREIEEYNRRISSQKETLKDDIQKNQGEIDYIIKEVQKNVAEQNYEEVKRLKDRLLIISDKKDAITNEKTLIMEQLSVAMKKKSEIVNKMKQANLIYYAEKSGILSKNIDGFEDEYSYTNLNQFKMSDLKDLEVKTKVKKNKEETNIGEPLFKIIESQEWFIMTKISNDNLGKLRKGMIVPITIDKNNQEIDATIVKLEKTKDNAFLVLKLDKHLHDFYKQRDANLKIIKSTYSGLKVPRKAVVEKDGVNGVFIKDISGVVKFREVKILKQMKDIIIIEPVGDKMPLKILDEVFVDGRKINEGQIVNSKGGN